jgi:endoribonuclease Dicer
MVSNSTLAAVCVWSGLQEHLLFESYILAGSIQAYADELKLKQAKEYELAEKEHRTPGQYWLEIEPPKVSYSYPINHQFNFSGLHVSQALSDVVESIIGATYISEDFSPSGVEAIFDNVLKPFYDRHVTLKTLSHHPTKILFELFQAQGCQQFEIVKDKDEDQQLTRCDGKLIAAHRQSD